MPIYNAKNKATISAADFSAAADQILAAQHTSGEIPWDHDQKTDPWDLVEAAMGLQVAGYRQSARKAYEWLAGLQNPDGSWFAAYENGIPADRTRDANMSTYIAVGIFHDYLISRDSAFVRHMWPTVAKAIDFALRLQAPVGEIHWAISPEGRTDPVALLTGSSSIAMSLKCALALAAQQSRPQPHWETARARLMDAIRHRPYRFNMTKSRYAMDWFYPVLCGAFTGIDARRRIAKGWKKFIIQSQGVRCVSDQPWVTIAETCELVLALCAIEARQQARIVFDWIRMRRFDDGSFWCGFTHPKIQIWPEEKMTWTNGVVLLALDCLQQITPAADLFRHQAWNNGTWLR